MSLAPPLLRLRLRAPRRDAAVFSAGPSRPLSGCLAAGRGLGSARAYCLSSGAGAGRREQVEAGRGLGSALGQDKTGFGTWGVETDTRRRRDRRGGPGAAAGGGGGRGRSGGGVGGGGGGGWFRWFASGGFWDAVKQTVLTILGIIAAFFLIANFNVLVAAAVNPLLVVLRQIRRAITFAAHYVSRAMSAPASRPKPTPVASDEVLAAEPVKGRVGMSAKERVVAKWRSN